MLATWKKSYDQPRQHIEKQRHYFANKGPSSQSYGFYSIHVWMWELDHKKAWALKNWCFRMVVLEKTLESPLDNKEIKRVSLKGNQTWIFIWSEVAQLCATLCNPMDCSLPGYSFQARILEWIAIYLSRGSFQPKDRTQVSHIAGRCFTLWAIREAHWGCESWTIGGVRVGP